MIYPPTPHMGGKGGLLIFNILTILAQLQKIISGFPISVFKTIMVLIPF